jgi:hypothetical protein
MDIVIALLLLFGLGLGVLILAAVGGLAPRLDRLAGTIAADAAENVTQHRITRGYIGKSLLEDTLLPHVGWRPRQKPVMEQCLIDQYRADVNGKLYINGTEEQ